MAHRLYTTPALLLESAPFGEANRLLYLFTEQFGLIMVTAQGVRALGSKLRHHLGPARLLEVTLVRGRSVWRLTGVRETDPFTPQRTAASALARVLRLARRLLPAEEPTPALFADFASGVRRLLGASPGEVAGLELLLALRLVHALGYLEVRAELAPYLASQWSAVMLSDFRRHERLAIALVNQALHHSQL